MSIRNLDFLFRPRSVAVIGASSRGEGVGAAVMRNLLKGGFRGPIASISGAHAYRDTGRLPQAPDLAVICTAPETAAQAVHELGARGTRAVAIVTSGGHAASERARDALRDQVLAAAKPHLLRVLGPDSMGLIIPRLGLNASFSPAPAAPGHIALVSQSGALTAAALDWAASRKIGFSYVVSLGDAADVDAADTLDYLANESETRAVLLYAEAVKDARKFLSAARAAARRAPVVVLKSGRTPEGAEAAARHTGSRPGADAVFDAALRRAGLLRVDTVAEHFAAAETLTRTTSMEGDRLLIVTNAGGPGVLAADALVRAGGRLATLAPETADRLARLLGEDRWRANPVDLGGDAGADRYAQALRVVLGEPQRDPVLLIHGPSGVAAGERIAQACATAVVEAKRHVIACWMGGGRARKAAKRLREASIPVHETPEDSVQAFLHVVNHRRNQETLQEAPPSIPTEFATDSAAVRDLLHAALAAERSRLTEPEGKALLAAYGVPVVDTHLAASADHAVELARAAGYPVALKVVSPDIEHRADVGGVMLNLESDDEVRTAARDIAQRIAELRPAARLAGFTVQRMIRRPGAAWRRHGAHEITVRATEDPLFGPVIHLHRGVVERFPEAAVGLVPLNGALAHDLIGRAGLPVTLTATSDRPGADLDAIAGVLVQVSQLLVDHAEIVELALDPLLADDKGAMVLEARIRVARADADGAKRLAIRPYPKELERVVEVRGQPVLLRPIRPDDAAGYAAFIAGTDAPDVRFRFFSVLRSLPPKELARYTQIDYDREMTFVAVARAGPEPGDILGEVRAYAHPGGITVEFAILVRSDMQRLGLGRALLEHMIEYCRQRGVGELIGQILAENAPMIALARRCGMEVELPPGASVAVAHLDLRAGPAPAAPRA